MNYGLVLSSYSSFFFVWKCFIIIDMTKKIFGSIEQLINVIALIVSGAYITHFMLSYSAIPVRLTSVQLAQVLFILYVLDAFKIVKAFIKKDVPALVMFASFFLVTYLSYQASGNEYRFLLYIPAIIFSLYDIEYDRVISVFLFLIGIILIVAIFSSQVNIISNYVYNGANKVRSSWGICYPTDYATIVLFFMMFLWTKKKKFSDWLMLFPAVISLLNAIFIASSRTSIICSTLLIIGIVVYNIFDSLKDRFDFTTFKKIVNILFMCVFPVCALFTLVIAIAYAMNVPFANTIDTLMSGRLYLTVNAVKNYGVHPFGSFFELRGGGFGGGDFSNGYNFIDNSYALIFIRYGWVYFGLILCLWLITMKKVLKEENYKLAIVLSVIAFHSISEHHYMDASFNLLLFMPFVNFEEKNQNQETSLIAESIAMVLTTVIFIVLLGINLPSFLSYVRTFVTVNGLKNANSRMMYILLPVLMLFAGLLIGIVYACKNVLVSIISGKKMKPIYLSIVGVCVLICLIVPQYKNTIFSKSYDSYLEIFQTEEDVVKLIKKNKKGKLYSLDAPEYYSRYFKGFSSGLLQGEELARQKNTTVIASIDLDSDVFFLNGFRWTQISDSHAIYTNDEGVISALESKDYQLDYYYTREQQMSTSYWGYMNDIPADEYGQLNVRAGENSLSVGPYCYLHVNNYIFDINLFGLGSVSGNPIDYEQPIANFQVRYVDTDDVLYEAQIYPYFDENGNYTYEFQVGSWRTANVYLSFEPINDCSVWIGVVTYRKIQ